MKLDSILQCDHTSCSVCQRKHSAGVIITLLHVCSESDHAHPSATHLWIFLAAFCKSCFYFTVQSCVAFVLFFVASGWDVKRGDGCRFELYTRWLHLVKLTPLTYMKWVRQDSWGPDLITIVCPNALQRCLMSPICHCLANEAVLCPLPLCWKRSFTRRLHFL